MLGALIMIAAAAAAALTFQRHEGYFGPMFADDGRSVVYVQRNAFGFVWGIGWESFTPPAHTWILDDRVSLRSLDVASGRVRVLRAWPRSPIAGRVIDEYRGRSFAVLESAIQADSSAGFEYAMSLSVPRVPFSERFRIRGRWSAAAGGADSGWVIGEPGLTTSEPVLSGDEEIMTVRGGEAFPAAIVTYASGARRARVLHHNDAFAALYADSLPIALLEQQSRRAGIERADTVRRVHAVLVARFRAEGLSEIGAMLRAAHEMELLSYYPRSPYLVARRVGANEAAGATVFDISDDQLRFGMFQDLERAMASPGEEIDFRGPYVIHRDFTTSQRLNAFVESGGRRFRVRRGNGDVFEVTLVRR